MNKQEKALKAEMESAQKEYQKSSDEIGGLYDEIERLKGLREPIYKRFSNAQSAYLKYLQERTVKKA